MFVTDIRLLAIVKGDGFTKMIHTLNSGYTPPSRTHFTKNMERKYEETFECRLQLTPTTANLLLLLMFGQVLQLMPTLALRATTSQMIGTCSQSASPPCRTDILHRTLQSGWIRWWPDLKLVPEKSLPYSMTLVPILWLQQYLGEEKKRSSVRCTGHTLQLVINAALKSPSIAKAVGAARCLDGHFKKSELASHTPREAQQQMTTSEHTIVQDLVQQLQERWQRETTFLDTAPTQGFWRQPLTKGLAY